MLGADGKARITRGQSRAWGLHVLAAIALSGCGTPYPPLTCDPDAAGQMVLGYQRGGAYFPNPGDEANGSEFLFIDGACRYWTSGPSSTQVVTGTLEGEELAAINAELMTRAWPTIDGEHVSGCCDGETIGLARDGIRASRYALANGSATFQDLYLTARRWSDQLAATGTAVAPEAPLRLEMVRRLRPSGTPSPWPLEVPVSELAGATDRSVTVHVFAGADAATLRGLETSSLTDGSIQVSVIVVDIVPFADEEGCLRPLFPGDCRILSRY